MDHLDDNAASEFVSGSLAPSAVGNVEQHLARCRDCRDLVAALAMDAANDSNAATVPHEKLSPSQVAQRPTRTLTIGDRVGRFLVLSPLGAGGMGVVFAAYDPQLDRKVALKLLRAGITYNTKDARTRLRREAQAIAQLSHPNVVAVYDVGATEDDDLYIAMEFVEGDTLTTWLKKYPRSWREILDVFQQAARGLIAAHSVGLLHRDFKPDNVLVGGDGRVRVTDFGLARSVMVPDESARPRPEMAALNVELTATGTVLGTPRYMAPEQMTGPDIDARADQFSFCVALYEALHGTHPLRGATSVSMLETGEKALPPPEGSRIPITIVRAVQRGLECDRAKRYPTLAGLIGDLLPPPPRATVRYVAFAIAGVMLIGGAVAAVIARPDEPVEIVPADNRGVQPLIDKINELEAQRKELLDELKKRQITDAKIQQLQTELKDKDEKIQELVKKVAEVTHGTKPRPLGVPLPIKVARTQSQLVTAAFETAYGDLEGCFVEWNEREAGEADMLVRMTVGADGVGHSSETVSGPDSPMLRLCVSESVGRVKFAPGPETLDLDVFVHWSAGVINVSPRVTGRRKVVPSTFDLR
ncbi:MAG: protein kinase [Deltaproteobacteria bacterium]|nr:protein kinase [Deltaproteobacteria bacterium]MDQ3295680.1 protein kinase [Myxococcota bacterium]